MSTDGSPRHRFKTHPESVAGDFYVVNGECVCCGGPHVVAPDLIGWADTSAGGIAHCIWEKQPETDEEVERAIMVIEVSEVGCHRYAGTNLRLFAESARNTATTSSFANEATGGDDLRWVYADFTWSGWYGDAGMRPFHTLVRLATFCGRKTRDNDETLVCAFPRGGCIWDGGGCDPGAGPLERSEVSINARTLLENQPEKPGPGGFPLAFVNRFTGLARFPQIPPCPPNDAAKSP